MTRAALVVCSLLALRGVARAETPTKEAARYFAAGNQAYEAGQYLLAATAYEEAYRKTPLPAIVFTMAQSYRRHYYVDPKLHFLERALALYRQYLAEVAQGGRRAHAVTHIATIEDILRDSTPAAEPVAAPPITQLMVTAQAPRARASIDGGELTAVPMVREVTPGPHQIRVEAPGHDPAEARWLAVEGRLVVAVAEPTPRQATLILDAPGGAGVVVDGRPHADGRVLLEAGAHTVTITQRGHRPFTRRLVLGFGEERALRVRLRPTRQRVAAYWVLGGAGALLVAGGVTTMLALGAQDRAHAIEARLTEFGGDRASWSDAERQDFNRAVSRRNDLRTTSWWLGGSAAVVATAGALLYFLDSPRAEAPAPARPELTPVIGPEMIGALWTTSTR